MAPFLGSTGSSHHSGPSSRSGTPPNEFATAQDGPEPIAIVGIACRFPGQSDTPADFWQMLVDQRSGYSEPPSSRFNIDGFHSEKANTGSLGPRGGYFISEDVYNFDPPFFGITQTEATVMDPQQRKLLECVYEAFEAGGIPLDSVSGKNIGTYVGNFTIDYGMMALRDMDYPKPYSMTGHGNTILSNRVSYVFNLCGPSFTIDTACSSSMYATHLASRALASGEIDGAVVGGTNLILDAAVQMAVDKMGVLSHTSTCHTFDASADGYGRAEGIGALYLKRLSDALRDGDPIRGVIRGTAANANGKTSGITQPSAIGQEAVIRSAYAFAGNLNPDDTSYFECHGTGTPVGDPIELNGITNMFLRDSKRDSLLIGAVKTNLGHAEAASATASIIKVLLAMENGTIPASIGVKNYNPKINFSSGRLQIVKETREWPTAGFNVRRASVNSFGYGGANAHAIIESSESYLPGYKSFKKRGVVTDAVMPAPKASRNSRTLNVHERTQFLLPFSAQDFPSLKANVEKHREVASQYDLLDLAFTLGSRRSFFFNRGYTIASADSIADNLDPEEMTFGKRGNGAKLAFIFTGQGAQSAQMGKELMESIPSYLQSIRNMDRVLQSLGEDAPTWSIEEALLEPKATSAIDQVHLSQPICTAVQVALVKLLREWGVTPLACVGHSSGEIAAAYAAGAITDEQAILAAYFRGVAVDKLTQRGTMLAVGLGPEEATPYLEEGVRIACYNSPQSVTLSGDEAAAAKVKAKLEADGVFVRALKTSGRAYHSHHMKDVGAIYEECANRGFAFLDVLEFPKYDKDANMPLFVSSVTGEVKRNFQPGPEYWRENLESPVRFTQAMTRMTEIEGLGINHIIEIGPHSALAGPIRQLRDKLGVSSRDLEYTATLSRGEDSVTRLLDLAGALFIKGYPIDLARVNSIEEQDARGMITLRHGFPLVDLPRYSWNYSAGPLRAKHRINMDFQNRKFARHDLLGTLLPGVIRDQAQWRNMLDIHDLPWLEQHKLGPQPVLPATGYIGIAVEAARQFFHDKVKFEGPFKYFIPRFSIKSALTLPPSGTPIEVMTSVRFQTVSNAVSSANWLEFTIQSVLEGVWTDHCVGIIGRKAIDEIVPLFDEAKVQEPRTSHTWYRGFSNIGLNYGPPFNGLSNIRTDPWTNECVADTKLLPTDVATDDSRYIVHPGAMDTCLQAILIGAHNGSLKGANRSFIPVDWEEVSIYSYEGTSMPAPTDVDGRILATGEFTSLRALWGSFQLTAPDGRPLFTAKRVNSITYAEDLNKNVTQDRHPYLRVVWKPDVGTLENGALPSATTEIGRSLSAKEKSLLPIWARILIATAKSSKGQHPSAARLIDAICALDISTKAHDAELAASNFSVSRLHPDFYRLETIYATMMLTLTGQKSATASVSAPSEDSLVRALDLVGHKYPGMKILQIVNSEADLGRKLPAILEGDSSLKRYTSYTYLTATDALLEASAEAYPDGRDVFSEKANLFEKEELSGLEGVSYDLIIVPDISSVERSATDTIAALQPLLSENGRVLIHKNHHAAGAVSEEFKTFLNLLTREMAVGTPLPDYSLSEWKSGLESSEFNVRVVDQSVSGWTLLSEPKPAPKPTNDIVVLSRENGAGVEEFSRELVHRGYRVRSASLSDENFAAQPDAIYVSIVELGSSLFNGNLNATEFANIQRLVDSTQAIFWLTSGDLLGKVDPNAAIVQGLGRTLQTEYIQLTFITIDLDHSDARKAAEQAARVLGRFSKETDQIDKEYIVKDDVFHVSRLAQDERLDREYGEIINREAAEERYSAADPIRLDIEKIGLLDTLHFKADDRSRELRPDEAEVEVKAVGLNMKEYATFRGSFHSESLSHEGAGVVRRVGAAVANVQVGDKVCWMGKGLFGNIERFKAMHLHPMDAGDGLSFAEMAGMPLVFATAVYGLLHLGRLRRGDRVLIHSATGGVGLAAVQVAQMVGAEVFATVGTPAKRAFLTRRYGIPDSHIFSSRDTSFAAGVMAATGGRGVDVALNSLVRELLAASWSVMANNGRHVEIGRTDILEFGTLDLNVFKRNTTFSAFDFGVVADDHPEIVADVMKDVMRYLREGKIRPLEPMALFPATQVSAAFAEFANPHRIGKVVVSFGPETSDSGSGSTVAVRREHKDAVTFKPDGTYVLIGCLGGLGRCLARFMVDRGARNLTFLGRSGADKKEAAAMIDSLRSRGCTVHVVRGDVSNKEDVAKAVSVAGVPVYGMVQGSMALEDKLFSKLDLPGWQYPIDPKVRGTWNLHECLAGQPLDFFVMLSSISAMTGAPTQSNYCAANTFLDFFARYRSGLGLPATTVGLSMVLEVGFVSQNLAIEQGIARSGIHGITERDFLLLMEQAMKPGRVGGWRLDPGAKNFLVSGLEPAKLAADLDVHGFRFWLQPRVGPLLTAIQRKSDASGRGGAAGGKTVLGLEDILEATVDKFAKTFMIPSDDVDPSKPLVAYGMDSMIGTALRNWAFSTFGVDVPTSDFMGPLLTAQSLADKIFAGRS